MNNSNETRTVCLPRKKGTVGYRSHPAGMKRQKSYKTKYIQPKNKMVCRPTGEESLRSKAPQDKSKMYQPFSGLRAQ